MTQIVLRRYWGVSKYRYVHNIYCCKYYGRKAQHVIELTYSSNNYKRKEDGKQLKVINLCPLNIVSLIKGTEIITTQVSNSLVWHAQNRGRSPQKESIMSTVKLLAARICENRNLFERKFQLAMNPMTRWVKSGAVSGSKDFDAWDEGRISLIQMNTAAQAQADAELERFTGASRFLLGQEKELSLTDKQEHASKVLFRMAMAAKDKDTKARFMENRKVILEANKDKEDELDKLIHEQEEDMDEEESYNRLFRKTQAQKGYELVEWFKVHAPTATREKLIKWSRSTNKRRLNPDFEENRLSFCHWVASKIVLEYWLSRRCTKQYKVRAVMNHTNALELWDKYNLQDRYNAHLHTSIEFAKEVDMDASYSGRYGVSASRMEEFIDVHRDKDEDLLMGFLLFREKHGFQLPQGKEAKSFANVLIALNRCNGNRSAAAKLLGVAKSIYNGWVKQATKKLNELNINKEVKTSIQEGLINNR